jgi:hypothetical protein
MNYFFSEARRIKDERRGEIFYVKAHPIPPSPSSLSSLLSTSAEVRRKISYSLVWEEY